MLIDILKSIIFGIIQGISEYLPISSTAHLILFNNFMHIDSDFFEMFKVVIQFGSILAVCILYFHKLNPFSSRKSPTERHDTLTLWSKIIIGVIPAAVFGLLFDDLIENKLSSNSVIAATLIIYGVIFIVVERVKPKVKVSNINNMSYLDALKVGFFQVLALVPGTSRSGATIIGSRILGFSKEVASEFSFFLAVPTMAGASLLKVIEFGFNYTFNQVVMLVVGTFVSFIVSVWAIKFLLDYIKKHDFTVFGYYRILLGILILLLI